VVALGGGDVLVARSAGALGELAGSLDGPVRTVAGDVGDTMTAGEALDAADELGGLWGLVNNAGINPFYHPVTDTPLAEWDEVLRVNVLGAAAMARAVGRELAAAGRGGRIVNLSSIAGLTGLPNIGPYNASKAALDALTRTLAVELGPGGILVNSVAPGTILTEMVEGLMTANPALKEKLVAKSPLGRLGAVAEAAWPIVFLLTDAASFITGHTLVVDGGRLAQG
jgi:3alpha(or 20beta)-hydroxysteroid dehydrogenase